MARHRESGELSGLTEIVSGATFRQLVEITLPVAAAPAGALAIALRFRA